MFDNANTKRRRTKRLATVDKRYTENQQTNNCGQTSNRKPIDKQLWTNVTQKTNRQTTMDKRHRNQQTNNCGQTPHRKPTDKQLWTNATQKTNRQTTVEIRHTENQQTNNCGQTPHRKLNIKPARTPLKEG